VATVELRGREEIQGGGEEADPSGAANGMKEKITGAEAMAKNWREKMKEQWSAEDDFVVGRDGEVGDELGVEDAEDQGRKGDEETDEWAGGADVEERTSGANRRTDEDEGAERADERGKGNEEGIAGVNVVMAAGEEMAELVGEKDGEQGQSEGKSGSEGERMAVEEREGAEEFVPGDGFVVGVGDGEVRAGDEAGAKGEEEEGAGDEEGLGGGAVAMGSVDVPRGGVAPVLGWGIRG